MTCERRLFVLIAADWIMGTWCARLGRMAGIRRGVKDTMCSGTKCRNSASQRNPVDCCISSSVWFVYAYG